MYSQAHNAYLESRVLTADPLELVCLLYQAAITEVRNARTYLAEKNVGSRSTAITKACNVISELTSGLRSEASPEYVDRLRKLYSYMMTKLSEANFQQKDEPLVEVLGLLTTMLEGWEGARTELKSEPVAAVAMGAGAAFAQQEASYTPQAWSF
jgi:flagellar protein FliS